MRIVLFCFLIIWFKMNDSFPLRRRGIKEESIVALRRFVRRTWLTSVLQKHRTLEEKRGNGLLYLDGASSVKRSVEASENLVAWKREVLAHNGVGHLASNNRCVLGLGCWPLWLEVVGQPGAQLLAWWPVGILFLWSHPSSVHMKNHGKYDH